MSNYTALSGGSTFEDIIEEIRKMDAKIAQQMNQRSQKFNQKESVHLIDKQLGEQIKKINGLINEGRTQLNKKKNLQVLLMLIEFLK
ncbi:unnamed protein product (macronuclear) [Paramecium tetraurelia]|uniref:Syntaxin N-terminal domain-containing protein n=1 Tax=Paramecium tetraurelia TaxID=5888 RepID=A0BB77_PARTE|nr:uncharacterized protein GSPATT00000229001 [Paramecium tetraurelia]CAK55794.1 unnamed protein product [Paramecium tetraurelia]|eukprot:XP_001423192.1 hypothetical protein (macronuclear) [Paramecium tetraurelia strain d4-2]